MIVGNNNIKVEPFLDLTSFWNFVIFDQTENKLGLASLTKPTVTEKAIDNTKFVILKNKIAQIFIFVVVIAPCIICVFCCVSICIFF